MIPHRLQYARPQAAPPPERPQTKVAQWNLSSSLPSAAHRSSRRAAAAARDLTRSLCSSKRETAVEVLWILRIRWILGVFAAGQPVLKMMRMMFSSSASSSEIGWRTERWCSRSCGVRKTSPQAEQGWTSGKRVELRRNERVEEEGDRRGGGGGGGCGERRVEEENRRLKKNMKDVLSAEAEELRRRRRRRREGVKQGRWRKRRKKERKKERMVTIMFEQRIMRELLIEVEI